jgi:hypothetical protein
MSEIRFFGKAAGVNEELGLVFGYAAITEVDGKPYYDLQKDHITEDALLDAATDFMLSKRVLGDMHERNEGGSVVFAWPLTKEIAKAFGIETSTYGLMIAIKPKSEEMFNKFKTGEYTGFSIGGRYIEVEEVVDED